jgi:peptide/nickel transport system substrate-binding protein
LKAICQQAGRKASDDQKEWTFTLTDNVFSDGTPVREAVKLFERLLKFSQPPSEAFRKI